MRPAAALALALIAGLAAPAAAQGTAPAIASAEFFAATDRYRHHIMGHVPPWAELHLAMSDGSMRRIVLPETLVFEDMVPRLADLDGDGAPEVVVVETHVAQGAALAVYGPDGRIAATPYIGTPQRWLAPAGIADLDGDGAIEIAYVDRPHLAKELRIWRYEGGTLTEVGRLSGVTNHAIGEAFITGGVRDCGTGPELVLLDADRARIVAVTFDGTTTTERDIGPFDDQAGIAAALACTAGG